MNLTEDDFFEGLKNPKVLENPEILANFLEVLYETYYIDREVPNFERIEKAFKLLLLNAHEQQNERAFETVCLAVYDYGEALSENIMMSIQFCDMIDEVFCEIEQRDPSDFTFPKIWRTLCGETG